MDNVLESAFEVADRLRSGGMVGCVVENIRLHEDALGSPNLEQVRFVQSTLEGVQMSGVTARDVSFTGCQLRSADVERAWWRAVNLVRSQALEINFAGSLLDRVGFYDTRMTNAVFSRARLHETTFQGADLMGADFSGSLLTRCRFEDPRMGAAALNRARFRGAFLVEVDLCGAVLYGADLRGATFLRCDLTDAVTEQANLDGVRFIDCQLTPDLTKEAPTMTDRRDFGMMAQEMREALDQCSREDLVDLLTHLTRVYVIEGAAPAGIEEQAPAQGLDALSGLTFAQLILHLQMNLPHDELRDLRVSGQDVWLGRGGQEVPWTVAASPEDAELPPDSHVIDPEPFARGAEPAARPAADESPRRPASASDAPLWDRPAPASHREAGQIPRPSVGLRGAAPARQAQPPAPDAAPDEAPDDDIGDTSDRFRMLELD